MTVNRLTKAETPMGSAHLSKRPEPEEKILCPHCQRTATNGIKCKGYCVADSDY